MQIAPEQRKELLIALDKEAKEYSKTPEYKAQKEALHKKFVEIQEAYEKIKEHYEAG